MDGSAMNPKVKAMWTAALRSGEYQQAHGYLRTDEGYCCLGVLCEIAVANKVIPAPIRIAPNTNTNEVLPGYGADEPVYIYGGGDQAYLTLPEAVREWAEVDDYNPLVTTNEVNGVDDDGKNVYRKAVLSELNDAMQWGFPRIADTIDEQL